MIRQKDWGLVLSSEHCALWMMLFQMHTPRLVHTLPPASSNSPKEESAPSSHNRFRVGSERQLGSDNTTKRHGLLRRPFTHRLRVFKSMQVQVIVHGEVRFQVLGAKQKQWGSTSSREDGGWGQWSDKEQQMSLSPHEGRPQSQQQQIKKTKVEQCVSWCWIGCYCPGAERALVPIMNLPGLPQRLSGPGISSAFRAQTTQANPILQHWMMTEVRCSLLIGLRKLHSIVRNKEEAAERGVVGSSAAPEEHKPTNGVCGGVWFQF